VASTASSCPTESRFIYGYLSIRNGTNGKLTKDSVKAMAIVVITISVMYLKLQGMMDINGVPA
jgi:hypothetical protein